MVLSRLKAGGAGTTTKEKVTLQRGGFKLSNGRRHNTRAGLSPAGGETSFES